MRLSFYTLESEVLWETPQGLMYLTRSGAELTADTAAISPELWGNFPKYVWIPALDLIGQPTFRIVQDTGAFKPGIIDVFLPVESEREALIAIDKIRRSGSPFVEQRKEVVNGREYTYAYVKVYECKIVERDRSRSIPEHTL